MIKIATPRYTLRHLLEKRAQVSSDTGSSPASAGAFLPRTQTAGKDPLEAAKRINERLRQRKEQNEARRMPAGTFGAQP